MIGLRCVVVVLLVGITAARAEDDPTPEERIEKLRADFADEHAALGIWAVNKKLGSAARPHLYTAIRLDPDCRRARLKLGHRRGPDGEWDASRERELRDKESAHEKYGADFEKREAELYADEVLAYEALGLSLRSSHRQDLAEGLLLHAHFLAPNRAEAARGLSLVRIAEGYGPERLAKDVNAAPQRAGPGGAPIFGPLAGVATQVRKCGSVVVEVPGDAAAAGRLATLGQKALVLTTRRLTRGTIPDPWIWFVLTNGKEQFDLLLDRVDLVKGGRDFSKAIGTARIYSPRQCLATYLRPGVDPVQVGAPIFLHMMAENAVRGLCRGPVPFWFVESVGIDSELTILGSARTICITWESSQGLVTKEALKDVSRWPKLLWGLAAAGELPRLEHLSTAQVQALSPLDVVASHAYYRLLCLTHPEGLERYLSLLSEGKSEPEAFEGAFGGTHEDFTRLLVGVLLGS